MGSLDLRLWEEVRKGDRDDAPGDVFFIPAFGCTPGLVHLRVVGGVEMDSAMRRGRVRHDTGGDLVRAL